MTKPASRGARPAAPIAPDTLTAEPLKLGKLKAVRGPLSAAAQRLILALAALTALTGSLGGLLYYAHHAADRDAGLIQNVLTIIGTVIAPIVTLAFHSVFRGGDKANG